MKLKWLALFVGIFLANVALPLQAADLMEVYYQAIHADPTFKKAEADWQSAKENLPIARAGYLPQLNITGSWQREYTHVEPVVSLNSNGTNTATTYSLTLTQPIFNFVTWKAIASAKASVKSATATYAAAEQDLMVRVARAYFSVLQAYDQLRYTLARKKAVYQQLEQAEEQFKVGLIAITGVYDARSVYDQAAATAIADKNRLNDAIEELRAITGQHYIHMQGIGYVIPLVKPTPNDINQWVRVAKRQNYSLRAQNYSVISARETVKQQAAGWMPQINFVSTYTKSKETIVGELPTARTEEAMGGLELNFPLIQGGLVSAQTKQAAYNYLSASSQLLFVEREVVSDTRQSFLGVITGISQVKADSAAVQSAKNALEATKVGYEVGTRTMVDVLDDLTSLYQEQQRYTDDQYRYILDIIELKANAGILKPQDLAIVNSWLKKRVRVDVPPKAFGPKLKPVAPPPPLNSNEKNKSTPTVTDTDKTTDTTKDKTKDTTTGTGSKPDRTEEEINRRIEKLKQLIKQQSQNTPTLDKKKKHEVVVHKSRKRKSRGVHYANKQQQHKITAKKKLRKVQAKRALKQPVRQLQLPKPISTKAATPQLPVPKKTVVVVAKQVISADSIIPLHDDKASRSGIVLPSPKA